MTDRAVTAGAAGTVLVVDDEAHVREIVAAALAPLRVRVLVAESADAALDTLANENVDVVVSDFRMPGMDGLEFLRRVRVEKPDVRFVLISGHGNMEMVIRALRLGAADFATKPFDNQELRDMVSRQLRTPTSGLPAVAQADDSPSGLLGESPAFLRSLEGARKAAARPSNVLLTGETGTGKERFARFIHEASPRRDGPFIPVNCGAIPETLIESELFGHVRGAFTGAISDRPGKFVLAHGGTLFLDEIAEMPLSTQVRLLRALQERAVEPVGGSGPVPVDFRLIAATHRDLNAEVHAGRFREDLRYRLNVVPLDLPPLRAREGDVALLARRFLEHFNERYDTAYALEEDHLRLLQAHAWPGNVRELANVIERAVVLSEGGELSLQLDSAEFTGGGWVREAGRDFGLTTVRERRRAAERDGIASALEACKWNKTQAAARLGISRRGLLYKLKEYGMG